MSKDEQMIYDKHEKNRHHEASLYESTYKIGKLEEKKEIALKLINANIDMETIRDATGLSSIELINLTDRRN